MPARRDPDWKKELRRFEEVVSHAYQEISEMTRAHPNPLALLDAAEQATDANCSPWMADAAKWVTWALPVREVLEGKR